MCINCLPTNATDTKFEYWKWNNQLFEEITSAGFDPKKLNEKMVLESTRSMMRSIEEEVSGSDAAKRLAGYELNVFTHNSLKNYRFLSEAKQAAEQLKGAELKQWLKVHNDIYYKNYHSTELQAAVQITRAKEQWAEIEEMSDVLPWLTFHAIRDERTRDSHAALDGLTYRANDPIWQKIFPPLDYNCRCFVTQEFDGTESPKPANMPTIPKAFVRDFGSEPAERLFSDKSPFMDQGRMKEIGLKPVSFAQPDFKQMNEAMSKMLPKLQYGWVKETIEDSGTILSHIYAKPLAKELEQIRSIVTKKDTVYILPKLEENFGKTLQGFKNPDAFMNGQILEMKMQKGKNLSSFLQNSFRDAKKQNAKTLVLSINTFNERVVRGRIKADMAKYGIESFILILDKPYRMNIANYEQILSGIKSQ